MRDRVFERELEVGLSVLRGVDAGKGTDHAETPVGLRAARRRIGAMPLIAAGIAVVAGVLWLGKGPPEQTSQTPAEVLAQDPLPPVTEEQILEWIGALSGPQRSSLAATNLVVHAEQSVPYLAKALAQGGTPAEPILLVLGCCTDDAAAALDAALGGLRRRDVEHAHALVWALAQLTPYTTEDPGVLERRFLRWYGRAPQGPVASALQGIVARRDWADGAGGSIEALARSLAAIAHPGAAGAAEFAAEQLARAGEQARPALEELLGVVELTSRQLITDSWSAASWAAADPTIPAAPAPAGHGRRWSVSLDARGRLHLAVTDAAEGVAALSAGQARTYRTLLFAAAGAVAAAPADPRTVQARIVLAAASPQAHDRISHLDRLLQGDRDALREQLPLLDPLVRDPDQGVARHAVDVVAAALASAQQGAPEAPLIETWARDISDPGARQVLLGVHRSLQR